jgi:hypothetical protein
MTPTPLALPQDPGAPPTLRASCLRLAPELASLALLEDALRISLLALLAEHPTLAFFPEPPEPPSLRRARHLLCAVRTLRRALDRYRASVHDALNYQPPPDTSPF